MPGANSVETSDDSKRRRSELRFSTYALNDCIEVARAVHEQGGGTATLDQLAAYLNYAGTNNGAFLSRVAGTRSFGLITKSIDKFVLTQLGQTVLMPEYEWQAKEAMVQAFLNVELFHRIYEDYKGKELPPEMGLKNALKARFGIAPARVDRAYRALMDSADQAGFFATRGTRTHLIQPVITKGSGATAGVAVMSTGPIADEIAQHAERTPLATQSTLAHESAPLSMQAVKAKYVKTLIDIMEERAKAGGELDEQLMARIEKLLSE
jgi:hypothetical protein